jgi:hypothetical protein
MLAMKNGYNLKTIKDTTKMSPDHYREIVATESIGDAIFDQRCIADAFGNFDEIC